MRVKEARYLIPYGNCIAVKGKTRSIICDLQMANYDFIPNSMADFIQECKTKSIQRFEEVLEEESRTIMYDYINFLVEKEYAFLGNEAETKLFPQLNDEWDEPFKITNATIDIGERSDINSLVFALSQISAEAVQFRFFYQVSNSELEDFFKKIKDIDINAIQIILPFAISLSEEFFLEMTLKYPRLNFILLYNALEDINDKLVGFVRLIHAKQNITDCRFCGIIQAEYFTINIKSFTESQHHNTCLNRKISIDINGDIKNCPSMTESYGNIKNTTLKEALDHPDFKKYWNIKKDDITKCKDCEFRHICTDCRAFREDPEDIYSAPLKCGYDPYTGKWEEWSTNPLKQKAIDHYGMREIL